MLLTLDRAWMRRAFVVRHAASAEAEASLAAHEAEIELLVHDDGVGVREQTVEESARGIRRMRDRALLIGAGLEVVPGDRGVIDVRVSS